MDRSSIFYENTVWIHYSRMDDDLHQVIAEFSKVRLKNIFIHFEIFTLQMSKINKLEIHRLATRLLLNRIHLSSKDWESRGASSLRKIRVLLLNKVKLGRKDESRYLLHIAFGIRDVWIWSRVFTWNFRFTCTPQGPWLRYYFLYTLDFTCALSLLAVASAIISEVRSYGTGLRIIHSRQGSAYALMRLTLQTSTEFVVKYLSYSTSPHNHPELVLPFPIHNSIWTCHLCQISFVMVKILIYLNIYRLSSELFKCY